jgi:hypothetical protein
MVELVKILRELSRRKAMVAVVLVFSLVVGLLLAFKPTVPPQSRQYEVALANSDILLDTRDSQVVAIDGHGPELVTLAARANLIGNLMTGGPLKDAIARQAGVPVESLAVVPPANVNTPGVTPLPVESPAARGLSDADRTVLTLTTEETLPIIHITAQAPDEATARAVTEATVSELKTYLGTVAASQKIPAAHQLVVREFGSPVTETVTRGIPRSYALIAAIGLALLGCSLIVGGAWFVRSWRQILAAEEVGHPDAKKRNDSDDDPSPGTQNGDGDGPGIAPVPPPGSPILRLPL